MACLTAAELVKLVREALHLPEETPFVCWSDSMIALGWLRGRPERWNVFVSHRVSQIQELTCAENWRHCRSEDNPADLLTRGVFAEQLVTSADAAADVGTLTAVTVETDDGRGLFKVERYGTLSKATRVVGWVLRFVHNARSQHRNEELATESPEGGDGSIS